ncbi:MAG: hypothetical protein AAAFM81_11445, partial [Pseudomonadota bacterium]
LLIGLKYPKLVVNDENIVEKAALDRARANIVWMLSSDERTCQEERAANNALDEFRQRVHTVGISEDVRAGYIAKLSELETYVASRQTVSCP